MLVGANYTTNEIAGSFWRPHDYMAKVPTAHVTGLDPEFSLTISAQGKALADKLMAAGSDKYGKNDWHLERANESKDEMFRSEDGQVNRYNFNIFTGEVNMINVAV